MSTFSGAGSAQVDMNQYNLPSLEAIAEEWNAVIAPATPLREEGIYLEAKSKREIMVDTVKVQIPRKVGQGLGLELLELAGGREDGRGITIVSGLVPGGCADGSGVMEGDSISKVEVVMGDSSVMNNIGVNAGLVEEESQQNFAVETECLGYDKTVEAIGSLPLAESNSEKVILTLKRLRRKPTVKVNFQYPPEMQEDDITIELFAGENLRRTMLVKGLKLNDPLARRFDSGGTGDCGAEGTCATCAVSVVRGADLLNPPGSTETQLFKSSPRWRLSCKAIVGYGMKVRFDL